MRARENDGNLKRKRAFLKIWCDFGISIIFFHALCLMRFYSKLFMRFIFAITISGRICMNRPEDNSIKRGENEIFC
ncbi:hypothetical protein AGMMS50222_04090 [Endomicrobiia bacterium]|nr:hypothetical protein AGMMS49556_04420 [Endomicrobiia bacterium]GHT74630.1 hypothetical protein AGMMS50222_04090 [Endomicrobiia bacterium]